MPRSWGPSQDARRRLENLAAGRFKPRGRVGGFRPRDGRSVGWRPQKGFLRWLTGGVWQLPFPVDANFQNLIGASHRAGDLIAVVGSFRRHMRPARLEGAEGISLLAKTHLGNLLRAPNGVRDLTAIFEDVI